MDSDDESTQMDYDVPKRSEFMTTLRDLDAELWCQGYARIVQKQFQPQGSKEPVNNDNGYLKYRGIYYYSTNEQFPYVKLKLCKQHPNIDHPYPLVTCCNQAGYEPFLGQLITGRFNDLDLVVVHPNFF